MWLVTSFRQSFYPPKKTFHALIPNVGPGFGIQPVIFVFMFKDGRDKRDDNKQTLY
ncbi:hypothetical protein HanXRQr2_Chr07g0292541 [Helianthus annuus]|uniref:Uncharacterized protein n=1 Tax=Helianthus annuus TaxID=4232 RepID=A0A9K3IKA8_HELAN|nr:hypothetical protein HanXRQr2_Chr07g0292541 [Helianthus annuus]